MKISNRIKQFLNFYEGQEHIYDLCCDHGLIGRSLAQKALAANTLKSITFNDLVPAIVNKLKHIDSDIPKELIFYQTSPAQDIIIEKQNNLIIIAGIGGKLMAEIVENLALKGIDKSTTIVVSPHNNYFYFRNRILNNTRLKFTNECFIHDKGQYYTYDVLKMSVDDNSSFLIPSYFREKTDKDTREFAKYFQNRFQKAQNDPLRSTLLNFFITRYGAII